LAGIIAILLPEASLAQIVVPDVPTEIAVPSGYKLFLKVEAKGVQIYKAVEGKSGAPEWVLEAPLADLFDDKGKKVGCHYDGPAWEMSDGSKVIRDKAVEVKSAPAPNHKEDTAWLLVKVKGEEVKDGMCSSAVYIQRLQTVGGKAPVSLPKHVGTKVGMAYKAVYYFYGPIKTTPVAKAESLKGIPDQALKVLEYVDKFNKPMEGYEGGRTFGNFEKRLPLSDEKGRRIKYHEWDVNPLRLGTNRGTERLVTGSDGSAYFTNDHYATFKKIR
jgi:hypothetical protein